MNNQRFSRRAFIQRMGIGAAMVPLLHAERARAATVSGFPKRLVTVAWGNGIIRDTFFPPGEELVVGETIKALEPWKSKLLMPAGLDMKVLVDAKHRYAGHFSYPTLLTGRYLKGFKGGGISVDEFLAQEIGQRVKLPALKLNLGVAPRGNSTSYRGELLKNSQETAPGKLFEQLFSTALVPPVELEKIRARRKSLLDFVGRELAAFGGRLGLEDRRKVEAHNDSIREIEKQVDTESGGLSCQNPADPGEAKLDIQNRSKLMFSLLAAAMRCDVTRVATMDFYDDGGSAAVTHPFLGVNADYHNVAHAGSRRRDEKIKIDAWVYSQVADFVKQLDDTPEGGGTALDNSVVVTMNDMCDGAAHEVIGIPFLLIGSCGGHFKTGRVVRYGSWVGKTGNYWTKDSGFPHNRLLAELCVAMDVPVDSFGAPGYEGTLPELRA